jgi:hypothetical protein
MRRDSLSAWLTKVLRFKDQRKKEILDTGLRRYDGGIWIYTLQVTVALKGGKIWERCGYYQLQLSNMNL